MTIGGPLAATLRAIGAAMRDAHDPWWVIAGAAVALHGVDAGPVGDVDVLLSIRDAATLLPGIGVQLAAGPAHPRFRSTLFATWHACPLPVEFMAGFAYRSDDAWVPVVFASRERRLVGMAAIFVPDRKELAALLAAFGRSKDLTRARRLLE